MRINIAGGDNQFPWPVLYTAHCFDGIQDQVEHDLL
jgi:hypothetical protein